MAELTPPSSGFTGVQGTDAPGTDPFRQPESTAKAELPQEPDPTIGLTRIQFSIRLRFNPIRNLTPELLAQYLDNFRLGFFRMPSLAWEAMERRDTRLQTVAPKRKKSVSRLGWEVLTVDDSPAAKQQKDFLENLYNNISVTTALEPDEQGGFALMVRQMMDAVGKRYAVHEVVWKPQADGSLRAQLIFCPLWWFEGTRGKLRFLLSEFDIYGVDMDPGGWMVTVGDGLMEACSVAYMFKHLPLRDWLNFSEKFGTPGLLGKTEAAIDSPEWLAMENALKQFSADWSALVNQGANIDLIEAKNTGEAPFKPLVDMMNEEMTRLWRGSDLGTSSKHNATGASLQGDEGDILEADDAQMIGETLTRQLSRYALAWKFGDAPQLAYVKIKTSEKKNIELDLKVDDWLIRVGAPIAVADALERYDRAMPDDGEPLLTAPAAPAVTPDADPETDIANEAAAQSKLIARGKQALVDALNEDLSHVLSRLNEILNKTPDDEIFLKKLQTFAADYPSLKQSLLADPAAARALGPLLSAALANGIATTDRGEMANAFDENEARDEKGRWTGGTSVGDVLSGKHHEAVYADVRPDVADKIKSATGRDVSGFKHLVDREGVTHIIRTHGADELPVTKEDLEKIPQIVAAPDTVERGNPGRRELPTIKYSKRFNGTTYYVEEEWSKEKVLAAKTMWKVRTA